MSVTDRLITITIRADDLDSAVGAIYSAHAEYCISSGGCGCMDEASRLGDVLDAAKSAPEHIADTGTSTDTPAPSQAATEARDERRRADERAQRYADAVYDAAVDHPMWISDDSKPLDYNPRREELLAEFIDEAQAAVIALADVEQAELRAENERLTRALDDAWTGWQHDTNELTARAEKAEAKVAQPDSVTHPTLSKRRACSSCMRPMVTCALYCAWCGMREVGNIGPALDGAR
jgi:hypothetical protein